MAELLLINPRKRRRPAKRATGAKRPARRRVTRRNPISNLRSRAVATRRSNPLRARRSSARKRRRNPIRLGGVGKGLMSGIKDAMIGAAGAVGVDFAMSKLAPMLPAALQRTPGQVGAGDAVKAVVTVLLGNLLSKATKGLSRKMAQGALTVQAHGLISALLPAGMLGFYSPARIVQGTNRVGPIRTQGQVGRYMQPGATALLNGAGAYMRPGVSPLLSGARLREGSVR